MDDDIHVRAICRQTIVSGQLSGGAAAPRVLAAMGSDFLEPESIPGPHQILSGACNEQPR
jgi:hypothetical protein